MEDVLEELVGDIWDEHDDIIENIRPLAGGGYRVLCATELAEMMSFFDRETTCEAATVSGWVMQALGRIPQTGDTFVADGLAVTVTLVDANHPEEITVKSVTNFELTEEES